MTERINPEGMYRPYRGVYTQVIKATGPTQVHVAGTVPLDEEGRLVGRGEMAAQVREIWKHVGTSLAAAGARPEDVVRITVYALDVDAYRRDGLPETVAFFGDTPPTSTLVGVTRLAEPDYLVEIEVTAVLPG